MCLSVYLLVAQGHDKNEDIINLDKCMEIYIRYIYLTLDRKGKKDRLSKDSSHQLYDTPYILQKGDDGIPLPLSSAIPLRTLGGFNPIIPVHLAIQVHIHIDKVHAQIRKHVN